MYEYFKFSFFLFCVYQVLSPRSYRLIVTLMLQGHPGSSRGTLRLPSLLTLESALYTTQPHLGVSPHLPSDKEINLLLDYRPTFGVSAEIYIGCLLYTSDAADE